MSASAIEMQSITDLHHSEKFYVTVQAISRELRELMQEINQQKHGSSYRSDIGTLYSGMPKQTLYYFIRDKLQAINRLKDELGPYMPTGSSMLKSHINELIQLSLAAGSSYQDWLKAQDHTILDTQEIQQLSTEALSSTPTSKLAISKWAAGESLTSSFTNFILRHRDAYVSLSQSLLFLSRLSMSSNVKESTKREIVALIPKIEAILASLQAVELSLQSVADGDQEQFLRQIHEIFVAYGFQSKVRELITVAHQVQAVCATVQAEIGTGRSGFSWHLQDGKGTEQLIRSLEPITDLTLIEHSSELMRTIMTEMRPATSSHSARLLTEMQNTYYQRAGQKLVENILLHEPDPALRQARLYTLLLSYDSDLNLAPLMNVRDPVFVGAVVQNILLALDPEHFVISPTGTFDIRGSGSSTKTAGVLGTQNTLILRDIQGGTILRELSGCGPSMQALALISHIPEATSSASAPATAVPKGFLNPQDKVHAYRLLIEAVERGEIQIGVGGTAVLGKLEQKRLLAERAFYFIGLCEMDNDHEDFKRISQLIQSPATEKLSKGLLSLRGKKDKDEPKTIQKLYREYSKSRIEMNRLQTHHASGLLERLKTHHASGLTAALGGIPVGSIATNLGAIARESSALAATGGTPVSSRSMFVAPAAAGNEAPTIAPSETVASSPVTVAAIEVPLPVVDTAASPSPVASVTAAPSPSPSEHDQASEHDDDAAVATESEPPAAAASGGQSFLSDIEKFNKNRLKSATVVEKPQSKPKLGGIEAAFEKKGLRRGYSSDSDEDVGTLPVGTPTGRRK